MSAFYLQQHLHLLSFRLPACLSSSPSAFSVSLPVAFSFPHAKHSHNSFQDMGWFTADVIHAFFCQMSFLSLCPFFPPLFLPSSVISSSLCSVDRAISPLASVWWTIIWWWTTVQHFTIVSSPLGLCMGCCVCRRGDLDESICVCEGFRERETFADMCILWVYVELISSFISCVFTLIHKFYWGDTVLLTLVCIVKCVCVF